MRPYIYFLRFLSTSFYFLSLMLNPDYSYLFLDFETTWLDTIKDDPIQIGCLVIDAEGNELKRFSSWIKPNKPINELKSIVTYLTQTSLESLQSAPELETIIPSIMEFLDEKTVLIGHNISFDMAFLNRFIDRTPVLTIDTFPLTKTCLHFLPSYALEVIAHTLWLHTGNAHDALADCVMNKDVFIHCIKHLQAIRKEYMIFDYVLQKCTAPRAKVIKRTIKPYDFENKTLFLPPLQKSLTTNKKIIHTEALINENDIPLWNCFIWWQRLQTLLSHIDRWKQERILSFSHKSKQQIAEQILTSNAIGTATFQEWLLFVPELIDKLLHKNSFDEWEGSFIAKYLSQHNQWHTLIDINSSDDWKISHAITKPKPSQAWQVTLCTHEQLYAKQYPINPNARILFFDADRWRQSRWNRSGKSLDPLHLIQHLDHTIYAAELNNQTITALEQLRTKLQLFFGILWWELDTLFTWYAWTSLDLEPLDEHTRLPKAKAAYHALFVDEQFIDLHKTDKLRRSTQKERLQKLFSSSCIVEKNMYHGDKRWYTFKENIDFQTRDEMKEQLPEAKYSFLSTLNSSAYRLWITNEEKPVTILSSPTTPYACITIVKATNGNIFVLTSSKSHGQDLFQKLVAEKMDQQRTIVGENITWWVGKIIYIATKSTKPVLMIWWYNCFCAARAKKFAISTIIPYYCEGIQKPLLLADVLFYG